MSLLRAHGHRDPERYALGMLVDEANLVQERESTKLLLEMDMLRQHVATLLSKDARRGLKTLRDAVNVEARPRRDLIPGVDADEDDPRDAPTSLDDHVEWEGG